MILLNQLKLFWIWEIHYGGKYTYHTPMLPLVRPALRALLTMVIPHYLKIPIVVPRVQFNFLPTLDLDLDSARIRRERLVFSRRGDAQECVETSKA